MKLTYHSRLIGFILLAAVCCTSVGVLFAEDKIQSLVTKLGAGEDVSKQLISHGIKTLPELEKALLATSAKDSSIEENLMAHAGEMLLNAETRRATLRMLRSVVCNKPQFLASYHKTRLILKGAMEAEGILSPYDHESGPAWRVGEMECVIGVSPELEKLKGKKVRIVGRREQVRLPSRSPVRKSVIMTRVQRWYIPSESGNPFSGAVIADIISSITTSADFVTKQNAIDELANRGGYSMAWIQENFDSSEKHIKPLLIHVLDQLRRTLTADLPETPDRSCGWGEPVERSKEDVAFLELVHMAGTEMERIASQHKEYAAEIDKLMRIHALDVLNHMIYIENAGANYHKWKLDMLGTEPFDSFHWCNIMDQDLMILAPYMEQATELDFQDTRITDMGLSFLSNLKNLEILHIGNRNQCAHSKFLTAACTRTISGFPELKVLYFGFVNLGGKGLSRLAGIENLETLNCNGHSSIVDEDLVHIGKMKNLKSLVLTQSNILGDGLKHLKGLTKLESLNLGMGQELTTVRHLKPVKSLKVLTLSSVSEKLDAADLSEITGMELDVLDVRFSPVEKTLDQVVGKFPKLKRLYMGSSRSRVTHLVPDDCIVQRKPPRSIKQ